MPEADEDFLGGSGGGPSPIGVDALGGGMFFSQRSLKNLGIMSMLLNFTHD